MIIMSVDLGKARTGIAISDSSESFAFPKQVITEYNTEKLIEKMNVNDEAYNENPCIYSIQGRLLVLPLCFAYALRHTPHQASHR